MYVLCSSFLKATSTLNVFMSTELQHLSIKKHFKTAVGCFLVTKLSCLSILSTELNDFYSVTIYLRLNEKEANNYRGHAMR